MGFFGYGGGVTCLGLGWPRQIAFRLFAAGEARSRKQRMNANPGKTVDTSGIDISNHARLRAMTRLGVVEAADHIRELLGRAERVDVPFVTGGEAWKVGNIYIVTDADASVVQTVFEKEADR